MKNIGHIHIVGICGVLTGAMAVALKEAGYQITGSDIGFYPPVSTSLEQAKISFYAGADVSKMLKEGTPDIVIIGTASGSKNPETEYARANKIKTAYPAEFIGEYFAKENSIVCAGTWGKTSSSALLSKILIDANFNPSYMFGGVAISETKSAKLTDGNFSVLEGDEYKSGPDNTTAKFFYYKPTHLLLSAVSWDHADLYSTYQAYLDVFSNLVSQIPLKGKIFACADNDGVKKVLSVKPKAEIVYYGKIDNKNSNLKYQYFEIEENTNGTSFKILFNGYSYKIFSPMLGSFQAENITGCFAVAKEIGIDTDKIIKSISEFKGLKRRLEKRYEKDITVFDDIAHSPEKAKKTLQTLKAIYKDKIIAIFEPNTGGRKREIIQNYNNAFMDADLVIIPRLTVLKKNSDSDNQPIEGKELSEIIGKTHSNVMYIENDNDLVDILIQKANKNDVIAFLGSHGFRKMIEETINKLKNK